MTDDLFRLGWLDDTKLASDCLRTLAEKAAQYRDAGAYELDTQAIFVEPLLRGLGWDTLDHNQVDREYNREGATIGDIHLGGKDHQGTWKAAAIIEVKRLDKSAHYMEGRAYSQLRGCVLKKLFSASSGSHNEGIRLQFDGKWFVCGVVTNGATWRVYDFDPSVEHLRTKNHTPLCKFELQTNSDVSELVQAIGRNHLLNRFGLSAA
jgi:hypothetical protein